jgi:hypothetical protein
MSRLQSELRRLYLPRPAAEPDADATACALVGLDGAVRAMVLELARPAGWELLSRVWRGVQADLGLPAPAIAAEPVPAAKAQTFLALLRDRFLSDVAPQRVGLLPGAPVTGPHQWLHAQWIPAQIERTGNWSAFVAPDLAPIFADTPWLDTPPGDEGQADLLSRLGSIKPLAFESALARLEAAALAPPAEPATEATSGRAAGGSVQARHFLRQVMNDEGVSLALRIEAAKALLPYSD